MQKSCMSIWAASGFEDCLISLMKTNTVTLKQSDFISPNDSQYPALKPCKYLRNSQTRPLFGITQGLFTQVWEHQREVKTLRLGLAGRRHRGRPKRRFHGCCEREHKDRNYILSGFLMMIHLLCMWKAAQIQHWSQSQHNNIPSSLKTQPDMHATRICNTALKSCLLLLICSSPSVL